jgi:hypothetical protein
MGSPDRSGKFTSVPSAYGIEQLALKIFGLFRAEFVFDLFQQSYGTGNYIVSPIFNEDFGITFHVQIV